MIKQRLHFSRNGPRRMLHTGAVTTPRRRFKGWPEGITGFLSLFFRLLPFRCRRKPRIAGILKLPVKAENILRTIVIRNTHHNAVRQAHTRWLIFEFLQSGN
jgi:hypothetical protein